MRRLLKVLAAIGAFLLAAAIAAALYITQVACTGGHNIC